MLVVKATIFRSRFEIRTCLRLSKVPVDRSLLLPFQSPRQCWQTRRGSRESATLARRFERDSASLPRASTALAWRSAAQRAKRWRPCDPSASASLWNPGVQNRPCEKDGTVSPNHQPLKGYGIDFISSCIDCCAVCLTWESTILGEGRGSKVCNRTSWKGTCSRATGVWEDLRRGAPSSGLARGSCVPGRRRKTCYRKKNGQVWMKLKVSIR